jgi:hypothetical protein
MLAVEVVRDAKQYNDTWEGSLVGGDSLDWRGEGLYRASSFLRIVPCSIVIPARHSGTFGHRAYEMSILSA